MSKRVALTFDDGPNKGVTDRVLTALGNNGVKATFFVIGQNVEKNPELVQRAVAEGHLIGNHTYTHPWDDGKNGVYAKNVPGKGPREVSKEAIEGEVQKANDAIIKAVGYCPRFFRAPQGKYWGQNGETWLHDALIERGFVVFENVVPKRGGSWTKGCQVGWDVDSRDWDAGISVDTVRSNILDESNITNGTDGTIILCHDHFTNDAEAMEDNESKEYKKYKNGVIKTLKDAGWAFVTIDELCDSKNKFLINQTGVTKFG